MTHKKTDEGYPIFRSYLETENDEPYYSMNTLSFYYEDMARKQKLIEDLAKAIAGYDQTLTGNLQAIEQQVAERFDQWDEKLKTFDGSVMDLLQEWVDDGTMDHIVDSSIVDRKLEPLTAQLAEKVGGGKKASLEDLDAEALAAIEGGEGTSFNLLSIPQDKSVTPEKTDFIDALPTQNVYDPRNLTNNLRVYSTNGTTAPITGYSTNLDYRPIKPNTPYIRLKNGEMAFYDENNQFISGVTSAVKQFTTPPNAVSYRASILNGDISTQMMVEGTILPSEYIPFRKYALNPTIQLPEREGGALETDSLKGVKWAALGDSTTNTSYGKPYHQFIKDRTGIIPYNYGVNGTSIAVREGKTDSLLERFPDMIADADIITVLGGRNDISWAVPIGTMTDRVNNTVYGACHLLFKGLIEKYPSKKIGVMLPLQRDTDAGAAHAALRINAIKEVAEFYSLPVLDLNKHSGLTANIPSVVTAYMPDGLHPNAGGHEIISRRIEAWLRTL